MAKRSGFKNWKIAAWPRYGETNPRNTYMYDYLEALNVRVIDLKNRPLEWIFADAVHVHWPENAFVKNRRAVIFLLFLVLIKVTRKNIIWTVHNDPAATLKKQRSLYAFRFFVRSVDLFLLPSSLSLKILKQYRPIESLRWALLPLGLYPKMYGTVGSKDSNGVEEGRHYHLIPGRLTKKKAIIETVTSLCQKWPEEMFFVAGQPEDEKMRLALNKLNSEYKNLKVELRFLSEERIAELILGAQSVILNYPSGNINSGIATLAGTYATPLFVKSKPMRRDLLRLYKIKANPLCKFPSCEKYEANNLDIEKVAKRYLKIMERRLEH